MFSDIDALASTLAGSLPGVFVMVAFRVDSDGVVSVVMVRSQLAQPANCPKAFDDGQFIHILDTLINNFVFFDIMWRVRVFAAYLLENHMTRPVKAIVSIADGALLDVCSAGALADRYFPCRGADIALIWRGKQIECTRLHTMCDRCTDFRRVTGNASDFALAFHKLSLSPTQRKSMMDPYAKLSAFEENAAALEPLTASGPPPAVLSNGTEDMPASRLNGLASLPTAFAHH